MLADGGKYEGDFKDNEWHGHGVLVWPDGDRYEGDWKEGKMHGHGTYHLTNVAKCEGEWKDHKLLGMGQGWAEGREGKCYLDGDKITFTD